MDNSSAGASLQLDIPFADAPSSVDHDWQAIVRQRSVFLYLQAATKWQRSRFPALTVQFDCRGHAAGTACANTFIINYNDYLLQKYQQQFIDVIVPHEVAHLVVSARFSRRHKPHGGEWRQVMHFFGAEPRVTHNFESRPARRMRRYLYRCECPDPHAFTALSHRRARSGWRQYSCRICAETLRYSGETAIG